MYQRITRIFSKLTDAIPYFLVAYLAWGWAPVAWRHYLLEGKSTPAFRVTALDGSSLESKSLHRPLLLVFWATWCGPCTVELKRVQRMIDNGAVPREAVLAVTDESDVETVRAAVRDRGYTFPVALDPSRELFRRYEVTGTPTLVALNKEDKILWITSGLSPTLELRLRSYFQ